MRRAKGFGRHVSARAIYNVIETRLKGIFSKAAAWAVNGIDLSKWNGAMNWSITMGLVDFLYLRGGHGIYRDSRFDDNRAACLEYNKPFGVYWFIYVGMDLQSQLDAFVLVLREGGWVLPPVVDCEYTTIDPAATTLWIKTFMQKLSERVPAKAMIYTSPGWWNKNVQRNAWAALYHLWVAHWTSADAPILPADWTKSLFWQWSADGNGLGRYYGSINGDYDIDLNRFMGDLAAWRSLTFAQEQPGEGDETQQDRYVVLEKSLMIRSGPWTSYGAVGTRAAGDTVVAEDSNIWVKDSRGWSAVKHLGKDYMRKT